MASTMSTARVHERTVTRTLQDTETRLRRAHADHLGYPYNLVDDPTVPTSIAGLLVNNLGDPYVGSHFAAEVCELERQVGDWFMDLWDADDHEAHWASVGASGTEGNLWALYLGREAVPGATLLYTTAAHYSIPKAARLLGIPAHPVDVDHRGALDLVAFERAVATVDGPLLVALTCGTTMTGAHDDLAGAMEILERAGVHAGARFVHVDGALNAMVVPFDDDAPHGIRPSFRHGIDSISTSGHKMLGTPMPCGVLVTRRAHVQRVASAVSYLRSDDTTLMGSRNGHATIALWARVMGHGVAGFRSDARRSIHRAALLTRALVTAGVPARYNPHGLTVVFPEPDAAIVRRFQLACHDGLAHAIVMPSVTDGLLESFTDAYVRWWASTGRGR